MASGSSVVLSWKASQSIFASRVYPNTHILLINRRNSCLALETLIPAELQKQAPLCQTLHMHMTPNK